MLKALAFGMGAGAAIQAWRNFPPDSGPATPRSLALIFCLGILFAYLGGRFHGRHSSSAFASARAEANAAAVSGSAATVNLAVFAPGVGAGGVVDQGATPNRIPSSSAPWLGSERVQVSLDDLDGMDAADFSQETVENST